MNLDELRSGLDDLEAEGASPQTVAAEVIKIGAAMAVAVSGPAATIEGLLLLVSQIANEFPQEYASARASLKFPPTKGRA